MKSILTHLLALLLSVSIPASADAQSRRQDEGPKVDGTQADIDRMITEINLHLGYYQRTHPNDRNEAAARQWAFRQWAADHHDDYGQGPASKATLNRNVSSNLGVVDLDWLASIGHHRWWLPLDETNRYRLGKEGWLMIRRLFYEKSAQPNTSTFLNKFPDSNWRGTAIGGLLDSGKCCVEEVFRPGRETPAVAAKRQELSAFFAAAKFLPGTSTHFNSPNVWTPPGSNRSFSIAGGASRGEVLAALSPAPVGGVRLAGAGNLLAGLGELQGYRYDDASGVLELVARRLEGAGEGAGTAWDDIATVFRSVYEGGGPSISIDPDPRDPHGPEMLVVPDEITSGTHASWVMFECDRVMKGFALGEDNLTRRPMTTRAPGYAPVLDTLLDGTKNDAGNWERFWITPARRRVVAADGLQLLDLPLEVRTQRCALRGGKLVDVDEAPSAGARRFTAWFTDNYDTLGRETAARLGDSSLAPSRDPFARLKQLAGLTAVAEHLLERGVPLPEWISAYQPRAVELPATTPSLTVQRVATRGTMTRTTRVFGGVDLGGARLETVAPASLPARERARAGRVLQELARGLDRLPQAGPAAAVDCDVGGVPCRAVRLPLAQARVLGVCELREPDLAIPLAGGSTFVFGRIFNSVEPVTGPWGPAWGLDLPRLVPVSLPGGREGNALRFHEGYDLVSPMTGRLCRLDTFRPIPELGVSGLVAARTPEVLGLVRGRPEFWSAETRQLRLRSGDTWHFDAAGNFVAWQGAQGEIFAYEREAGRVGRIMLLFRGTKPCEIRLDYDGADRLLRAGAWRDDVEIDSVRYAYGADRQLSEARTSRKTVRYAYAGGRVVTRTEFSAGGESPGERVDYSYDAAGGLRSETVADGTPVTVAVAYDAGRVMARISGAGADSPVAVVEYDAELRWKRTVLRDPLGIDWEVGADGSLTARESAATPPMVVAAGAPAAP